MRYWVCLLLIVLLPSFAHAQTQTDYVVYVNNVGGLSFIEYTNSAFSHPQSLLSPSPNSTYRLLAAPIGQRVAVIRHALDTAFLLILSLPDAAILFEQPLLAENTNNEIMAAIGEMAWSPDGSRLAFVSGHDAISADVYLVDIATGSSSHLESESGQAAFLSWSPDGQWLVYSDLETFNAEAGVLSQSIFALNISGQSVKLMAEAAYPNDVWRVGWRDANTLLFSPRSFIVGARGLYSWELSAQSVQAHLPETLEVSVPVYSPISDLAGFVVPNLGGNIPLEAGFYLLPLATNESLQIFPGEFYRLSLVNESDFQLSGNLGELLLDTMTLSETVLPAGSVATFVSPNADYSIAYFAESIQITHLKGDKNVQLPVANVLPPLWLSDKFVTLGSVPEGTGLLSVDIVAGTATLLDSEAALDGTWTVVR